MPVLATDMHLAKLHFSWGCASDPNWSSQWSPKSMDWLGPHYSKYSVEGREWQLPIFDSKWRHWESASYTLCCCHISYMEMSIWSTCILSV